MSELVAQTVALLPMKEHSERVPRKNFREFHGKPLFRWVLDTLLSIDRIDLVVINTDARGCLQELGTVDAERVLIRDRRPELCGDLVSMNRIIEDDLNAVGAETYLMTHTTNPLLARATVVEALGEFASSFASGGCDSLFSVNRHQTRFYREDGSAINHDPNVLIRTQDLEPWFEENSCMYVFTRGSFADTGARIGQRPLLFELNKLESIDIDDQQDWDFAVAAAEHLWGRAT
jgi:CMP-N-acetylneuraminic acid synthetase